MSKNLLAKYYQENKERLNKKLAEFKGKYKILFSFALMFEKFSLNKQKM